MYEIVRVFPYYIIHLKIKIIFLLLREINNYILYILRRETQTE